MIRDKNKMVAYLVSAGIGLAAAVSGAFLVAPSEGYNNNTYLDPVDIITSCYGHTGNDLKQGQTFTDEQCLDQLSKDLGEANDAVNNVIHVPLTLWQRAALIRSEEHTSELQSLMRISYAVFCLQKKNKKHYETQ